MPVSKINNVKIFWEQTANHGDPLILVHGSWSDHRFWSAVVAEFSKRFRVLTYDRRGHSQSERLPVRGFMNEDVDDLIAFAEHLDLTPASVVGSSFGSSIVLKAAVKRPEIFKNIFLHEPPLFGLLKSDPEVQKALQAVNQKMATIVELIAKGQTEKAAEEFVEKIAVGPGTWKTLPEFVQKTFINNAVTWYDEMQDPESLQIDVNDLSVIKQPILLSAGTESPPFFRMVIDELKNAIPHAKRVNINGAGHVPQMSHPEKYIELVSRFCMEESTI